MDESALRRALDFLVGATREVDDLALGAELRRIQAEANRWSRAPNVVGFGLASRLTMGRRTRELAVKVYVREKKPLRRVDVRVPREILLPGQAPVPLDVEELGQLRQHDAVAQGGSGISHQRGGLGTLGCVVKKKGDPKSRYILGNSHVLALSGYGARGDAILAVTGARTGKAIATLDSWVEFVEGDGYANVVDAAIAKVTSAGQVDASIADLGMPTGYSYFVIEGMRLSFHGAGGAAGGRTQAVTVRDANYHGRIDFRDDPGWVVRGFRDQILTEPGGEPGDSGAIAVNEHGRIIGMHCGGSPGAGVFNKIRNVIEELGIEPVVAEELPERFVPLVDQPRRFDAFVDRPRVASRETGIDILGRTLWGEARGEADEGRRAVACVVLNRVSRQSRNWGYTVEEVCRKPSQFSCWNANDRNRAQLVAVTTEDANFVACLAIARSAIDGELADVTNRSTHYLTAKAARTTSWVRGLQPAVVIGRHLFYNNVK